jgi:molybdenum cofactor cytidylyltransferase
MVMLPVEGARGSVLADRSVRQVAVPDASLGMASSIRAGLSALDPEVDAVLLMLADMPDLVSDDLSRLIAAFDPQEGREIIRATTASGKPGHPVLFGRRFFEALMRLKGDVGAKAVVAEATDFVVDVALPGERAITDLDTPEAWARWRAGRSSR